MSTNDSVSDARRALNRLNRAAEKAIRELEAVRGALLHAEGADFPADEFDGAGDHLDGVIAFVEEQQQRLEEKILHTGGLEPGRVRRTGGG
jgi:hypothetical protein